MVSKASLYDRATTLIALFLAVFIPFTIGFFATRLFGVHDILVTEINAWFSGLLNWLLSSGFVIDFLVGVFVIGLFLVCMDFVDWLRGKSGG